LPDSYPRLLHGARHGAYLSAIRWAGSYMKCYWEQYPPNININRRK
jgi:hypothetical protein